MAAALLAGLLLGNSFASASAPANGDHRFKAIEPYDQSFDTYTDLGDPGLSQADLDTFHFEVYSPDGKVHLGYETSQCVVGSVTDPIFTFNCSSDFVLTDGQIMTEGTLEGQVDNGLHGLRFSSSKAVLSEHFAITGGTGRYRGVRGQLDWGGGKNAVVLSFRLLDD
jgi:hypothetical protein